MKESPRIGCADLITAFPISFINKESADSLCKVLRFNLSINLTFTIISLVDCFKIYFLAIFSSSESSQAISTLICLVKSG